MPTASPHLHALLGPTQRVEPGELTIRYATPADAPAIERLAQLDSAHVPSGELLVGAVAGEPWAAVSLDEPAAVADPFRPTGALVALLHERAGQLRRSTHARPAGVVRLLPRHSG